jgi:hypothetical protein
MREVPSRDRRVRDIRRQQPRLSRGHVVAVTGHPGGVEDQQPISTTGAGGGGHLNGQHRTGQVAHAPAGMVLQCRRAQHEQIGRRSQRSLAQ